MGTTRRTFLAQAATLILSTKALCSNLVEAQPFQTLGSIPKDCLLNLNFFLYGSKAEFGESRVYPYRLMLNGIKEENVSHPGGYIFVTAVATFEAFYVTFEEEYIRGISVWSKDGREIKRAAFSSTQRMIEGDTLNVRYTLAAEASADRSGIHGFSYTDGRKTDSYIYLRD